MIGEHPDEQGTDPRVVVVPESLSRSQRGQVAGIVYLELGGEAFPDPQWSDSVVVILGWWMEAILQLRSGDRASAELGFMDGPFRVIVKPGAGDPWYLEFVDENSVSKPAAIDLSRLENSALDAARAVDRACHLRGWRSADIARLQAAIRD